MLVEAEHSLDRLDAVVARVVGPAGLDRLDAVVARVVGPAAKQTVVVAAHR